VTLRLDEDGAFRRRTFSHDRIQLLTRKPVGNMLKTPVWDGTGPALSFKSPSVMVFCCSAVGDTEQDYPGCDAEHLANGVWSCVSWEMFEGVHAGNDPEAAIPEGQVYNRALHTLGGPVRADARELWKLDVDSNKLAGHEVCQAKRSASNVKNSF